MVIFSVIVMGMQDWFGKDKDVSFIEGNGVFGGGKVCACSQAV